jgi:hypothetical protein
MRWTLAHRQTCNARADGKAVWSWHPWAGVKRRGMAREATVTNKVMDTGESTEERVNTIAQGMPMLWLLL